MPRMTPLEATQWATCAMPMVAMGATTNAEIR
jgi:hypothetical protein